MSEPSFINAFKGFHIRTEEHSPSDEIRMQIAEELRVVFDELLATSAPVEELERTRAIISQAVSLLKSRPHSHDYEGPAEGSLAPMNSFLDRSQIIGAINQLSVPMRMDIEGDGGSESTVVGCDVSGCLRRAARLCAWWFYRRIF